MGDRLAEPNEGLKDREGAACNSEGAGHGETDREVDEARTLPMGRVQYIKDRIEGDEIVTEASDGPWSGRRSSCYYRQKIDADVIMLDDLGRYRGCVRDLNSSQIRCS